MKITCVCKNRDAKGNIVNYTLKDEKGNMINATSQQIKNEINSERYEFTNLQIDKAGRLVDKALAKNTPKTLENFYTVEELIKGISPKGRKVKCYDTDTGKYIIGIGMRYNINKEMAYNSIMVYFKENGVGKEILVKLEPTKNTEEYYVEYSKRFPLDHDEKLIGSVINFCKRFDLRMTLYRGLSYQVDAKPNPKGRYTIIEVGKYRERHYDGRMHVSYIYKIRDNKKNKEYWISEYEMHVNVHNNEFTNAGINENGKYSKLVIKKNIPIRDCTELIRKKMDCEEKIQSELYKRLDTGIMRTSDNQYFTEDSSVFDTEVDKVKKVWQSLNLYETFEDMMFTVFDDVNDSGTIGKKLYYGFMGIDMYDSTLMVSFNKEVVREFIENEFSEWVSNTVDNEECSKKEAIESNKHYRHTNID